MEITRESRDEFLELRVKGRLDAYWADHLSNAIEDAIRGGAHRIRLDMAEVDYMSSAGIRILIRFHKQLARIRGELSISRSSTGVRTVLELAGLTMLFAAETAEARAAAPEPAGGRELQLEDADLEIFDVAPGARLRCRAIGDPELLSANGFGEKSCRTVRFPAATFGVGVGAFGSTFADSRERFGEFVAAGGAAAYLPTDGTNVPDDLVSSGAFVPELALLYGVVCEGALSHLLRFETRPDRPRLPLGGLVEAALEATRADAVGLVAVAESAGLVGAALRRSPTAAASKGTVFGMPDMSDWLSFTSERAFARSLTLVVGVAATAPPETLGPWLRPLAGPEGPRGHFHAAAFSYQAIPKGTVELAPTVSAVFESQSLQGILHLLNDDRPSHGIGQSELVRGACWVGPIEGFDLERGAS